MNLKALRIFRAIVLRGSLAAAAEHLYVSESAASRLVSLLETELGIALFSRNRRRLVLTPEGEMFYRKVEQVLGGVDELKDIATDIRRKVTEKFTVITSAPLGASLAVPAITRMRHSHPGFECQIRVEGRFEIENSVARKRFSLGLISLPVNNTIVEVDTEPVFQARVGVLLPCDHPLAQSDTIAAAQLVNEPIITLQSGQLWRQRLAEVFATAGARPHIAIEANSNILVQQFVGAGNGISLLDLACLHPVPDKRLVLRPLAPAYWVAYGCIYPLRTRPPLADFFLQCLRSHLGNLPLNRTQGGIRILRAASKPKALQGSR